MFLKTAIIFFWLTVSYILLVFFSTSLIMAIISAFAVAQGFVLVGFNVMHDGNHNSYSGNRKFNRIIGYSADLIGGSSYLWRQKHNILHHTYTNISELDDDLQSHGLLRLSPQQNWKPWHRFQHWYALPLYSFLTLSWVTVGDFKKFFSGKIGEHALKRASVSETTLFFLTKIFYFTYTLIVPMFFHSVLTVMLTFVAIHLVFGFILSIIFQLAHILEENEFPAPDEQGAIENEWAIHQVETTANFATGNKFAAWYLGGLNFQIEHHLFAHVCHVHYPQISKIVERTCQEFSVFYVNHPTIRTAVLDHLRFLKYLGNKPVLS